MCYITIEKTKTVTVSPPLTKKSHKTFLFFCANKSHVKVHDKLHLDHGAFPWGYHGMPVENGAVTVSHLELKLRTFCKIGVVLVLRSFCKIGSKNGLMKFLRFRQGIICPRILLTLLFNKCDPKFRMHARSFQ